MLRLLLGFILLTSCSLGTKSSGGKHRYRYEPDFDYTIEDLRALSSGIVSMEKRDPRVGKLDELFDSKLPDIKRIGIIIFETNIQPTRTGLSDKDLIYPNEQGKQLFTEKFLSLWEEGMTLVSPDFDYVTSEQVKQTRALPQYGTSVTDYIKADRTGIENDDIIWLPAGKKTPMYTIMNPRGMRDLSFVMVPASELMGGPKWSEQNKIFVNDICKELKLDAAFVIMSEVSWKSARKDKFTNEEHAEELDLKIRATTLIPFGNYHGRLEALKEGQRPAINVAYRYHEGHLKIPIQISIPEDQKNFAEIEKRLVGPMFKAYRDLSLMMIDRMSGEIRKTH